jgi:hypothetical protein
MTPQVTRKMDLLLGERRILTKEQLAQSPYLNGLTGALPLS